MFSQGDNRRVALIKSLTTKNRFYALVTPEHGIQNADTVEAIPDDLTLGIAYPCLEDGLNDFAVIRTTFETLDYFPEDDPVREEMTEIIQDARSNLLRRLCELRDKIHDSVAHFLGTDYDEFKGYALVMVHKGMLRRNLDSMMKLNVFGSVAEAEGESDTEHMMYYYEFSEGTHVGQLTDLPARAFIVALFDDLLRAVRDDANYTGKYKFDKHVFQKFISVMFINYATTDPMFYGINKKDYGVSGDKDMEDTPLYMAIGKELREIEARLGGIPTAGRTAPLPMRPSTSPPVAAPGFSEEESPLGWIEPEFTSPTGRLTPEQTASLLPTALVNEEVLMGPVTSLCSAAKLLMRKSDPETQRFARVILADASRLVEELKRLGIVPPFANDPGSNEPLSS